MKRILLFVVLLAFAAGARLQAAAPADTVKILAVGNSFSEDAVEEHLSDLAREEGLVVVIGNMYIGGCSLERHVNNYRNGAADYRYRKIDPDGTMTEIRGYTLKEAFADEDWDYVSVQQASHFSGFPETYRPWLADLTGILRTELPHAEIMFHQTWAYSPDSRHSAFADYGSDQMKMYGMILSTVSSETEKVGIELIIPSGTAIQNARTSFLGTDLTRDGYHLALPLGRYIAACTWLEAVLGVNPVGNGYCPESLTEKECRAAQKAAHKAVRRPWKVTSIR